MNRRDDGRLYAQITRRSRVILPVVPTGRSVAITKTLEGVIEANSPDFFLSRFDRQISEARLRVYIRFLAQIGVLRTHETTVTRLVNIPTADAVFAQMLADQAQRYMATVLNISASQVPSTLARRATQVARQRKPPTVTSVVMDLPGNTEFLRWCVYLICDGDTAQLEIRRYPTLWATGQ